MLRKGDYEIHDGKLVKFNWGRGKSWKHIRSLTFKERVAAFFGIFPRIDE